MKNQVALTPSDEIGVMEDDPKSQRIIKKTLQHWGYKARIINGAKEAFEVAQRNKVRAYILDINMGRGRGQEGITALEQLKTIDRGIFVGILSAYPTQFKRMAYRLSANAFQAKSQSQDRDVCFIVRELLLHEQGLNKLKIEEIDRFLGLHAEEDPPSEDDEQAQDINYRAYQVLRSDPQWLNQHLDQYVAFVGGKLVEKDTDKNRLISKLQKEYSQQAAFFIRVEKHERVVDIPAPLLIMDDL